MESLDELDGFLRNQEKYTEYQRLFECAISTIELVQELYQSWLNMPSQLHQLTKEAFLGHIIGSIKDVDSSDSHFHQLAYCLIDSFETWTRTQVVLGACGVDSSRLSINAFDENRIYRIVVLFQQVIREVRSRQVRKESKIFGWLQQNVGAGDEWNNNNLAKSNMASHEPSCHDSTLEDIKRKQKAPNLWIDSSDQKFSLPRPKFGIIGEIIINQQNSDTPSVPTEPVPPEHEEVLISFLKDTLTTANPYVKSDIFVKITPPSLSASSSSSSSIPESIESQNLIDEDDKPPEWFETIDPSDGEPDENGQKENLSRVHNWMNRRT